MNKLNWVKLTPWLYLAFPLVLMGLFFFLPLLWAFIMSCLDFTDLTAPRFVGLSNYTHLLQMPLFWQSLSNTFVLMLLVLPMMVIIPIPMAILANQPIKGIQFFRVVLYFPVIVSVVVAAIIWKWLYADKGLINALLSNLGINSIEWLVSPDWVLIAIANMIVWKGAAYYMMMYLASLQSLNTELYEAAEVDGANAIEKHKAITLPHLKTTMALVAIVCSIGVLKVFGEIYVMTQGGPIQSSTTLVYTIYEKAFGELDLGLACAFGFVLMLIILAFSAAQLYGFYFKAEGDARYAAQV
jgi:putative chitobiose transport system permease protein